MKRPDDDDIDPGPETIPPPDPRSPDSPQPPAPIPPKP